MEPSQPLNRIYVAAPDATIGETLELEISRTRPATLVVLERAY
jgi:hypothetical protein